jgi:prephenate dehydrogenase
MKFAIIGGAGKMGRWCAEQMLAEGHEVVLSGRRREPLERVAGELGISVMESRDAVAGAEVSILSVPIDSFEAVVQEIASAVPPNAVVVEITSVKTMPSRVMREHLSHARCLCVHPMFGPGAASPKGQNFVLTPADAAEEALAAKARAFLETRGGRVRQMTPAEHDEMMTVVLGLSHFIAIVTADTLLDFACLESSRSFSSTTYRVLLDLVESVVAEDPNLYAALQLNMPGITDIENAFGRHTGEWAEVVRQGDRDEFVRRMSAMKEQFEAREPGFHRAYDNLYRIAES